MIHLAPKAAILAERRCSCFQMLNSSPKGDLHGLPLFRGATADCEQHQAE
jgi:hypothetical protein